MYRPKSDAEHDLSANHPQPMAHNEPNHNLFVDITLRSDSLCCDSLPSVIAPQVNVSKPNVPKNQSQQATSDQQLDQRHCGVKNKHWFFKSNRCPLQKSKNHYCLCVPCSIKLTSSAEKRHNDIKPLTASQSPDLVSFNTASYNHMGTNHHHPSLRSHSNANANNPENLCNYEHRPSIEFHSHKPETNQSLFFQVFVPFLISGFGSVGVSLVLSYVQHWKVFRELEGLMMLTCAILGYKGNLEMSLAARLSTKANCGKMDSLKQQWQIGYSNVALVQMQSIVLALLVALISVIGTCISHHMFNLYKGSQIVAISLSSSSSSSMLLAVNLVIVVIISRKCRINPDNVSTLMSACFGDVVSALMISFFSTLFYQQPHLTWYIIAIELCVLLPVAFGITIRNEHTSSAIRSDWYPVLISLFISSLSGFVFARCERFFPYIATFMPVMNGTGTNLAAVQVSRISTYLHQRSQLRYLPVEQLGHLPVNNHPNQVFTVSNGSTVPMDKQTQRVSRKVWLKHCILKPYSAFMGTNPNARTARLLVLMVIPAQLTYLGVLSLLLPKLQFGVFFVLIYNLVAVLLVTILMFICHVFVPFLWLSGLDPDSYAILVMMSLADFLGSCTLGITFNVLHHFQQPIAMVRHVVHSNHTSVYL